MGDALDARRQELAGSFFNQKAPEQTLLVTRNLKLQM